MVVFIISIIITIIIIIIIIIIYPIQTQERVFQSPPLPTSRRSWII